MFNANNEHAKKIKVFTLWEKNPSLEVNEWWEMENFTVVNAVKTVTEEWGAGLDSIVISTDTDMEKQSLFTAPLNSPQIRTAPLSY